MAKRIKTTKSKYSESYSIIDDYVDPISKKRTTFVVESLGSLKKLMEEYNTTSKEEVMEKLNAHLKNLGNKIMKKMQLLLFLYLLLSKLMMTQP